jgi:hypothetical protein
LHAASSAQTTCTFRKAAGQEPELHIASPGNGSRANREGACPSRPSTELRMYCWNFGLMLFWVAFCLQREIFNSLRVESLLRRPTL